MAQTVTFFNAQGDLTVYKPLAARMPDFLATYGPGQGYAVETVLCDLLALKPGLRRLLAAVVAQGGKPADLGIALGEAAQTLVCRARLRDAQGRVVATATAAKVITAYKEVEVLETAARQRLLAAVGFGGEILLEDEQSDWRAQGLIRADAPAPVETPIVVTPIEPARVKTPVAEAAPVETPVAEAAPVETPVAEAAPVETLPPSGAREDAALALMRQQIAALAALQGIKPPAITTRDQGRAVLRQLTAHR